MRNFSVMAAVAVALLAGGVASAEDKPAKAKGKKICRVEEDSTSRIGTRRICTVVAEKAQPARGEPQAQAARPAEMATPSD